MSRDILSPGILVIGFLAKFLNIKNKKLDL
jgi:hypothetical protein